MKEQYLAFIFICVTSVVVAQAPTDLTNSAPRFNRALTHGHWAGKRVLTEAVMKQVNIQGDQAKRVKIKMNAIDERLIALDAMIKEAALKQATLAKTVLEEPGASVEEIAAIIETIGKLRIEQAQLSMQILVVIRDELTPAQRQKIRKIIEAEGQQRLRERQARSEHIKRNTGKSKE